MYDLADWPEHTSWIVKETNFITWQDTPEVYVIITSPWIRSDESSSYLQLSPRMEFLGRLTAKDLKEIEKKKLEQIINTFRNKRSLCKVLFAILSVVVCF